MIGFAGLGELWVVTSRCSLMGISKILKSGRNRANSENVCCVLSFLLSYQIQTHVRFTTARRLCICIKLIHTTWLIICECCKYIYSRPGLELYHPFVSAFTKSLID